MSKEVKSALITSSAEKYLNVAKACVEHRAGDVLPVVLWAKLNPGDPWVVVKRAKSRESLLDWVCEHDPKLVSSVEAGRTIGNQM